MEQVSEASMDFKSLSSARAKLETQDLQITTQNDKHYRFPIEEGPPLIGVWNVLKQIGFRNRKNADMKASIFVGSQAAQKYTKQKYKLSIRKK